MDLTVNTGWAFLSRHLPDLSDVTTLTNLTSLSRTGQADLAWDPR